MTRCARYGNADFFPACWPVSPRWKYALGRAGEAYRLTEEAEALAAADDLDAQVRWRITRAKILARRGQFTAARHLAGEAEALIAPTTWAECQAEILVAKAEVAKLAGARAEAAASLRAALRIYEDRRAGALAKRTRAALASLPADYKSNRTAGLGANRASTVLQPPSASVGFQQRSGGGRHDPHLPHPPYSQASWPGSPVPCWHSPPHPPPRSPPTYRHRVTTAGRYRRHRRCAPSSPAACPAGRSRSSPSRPR